MAESYMEVMDMTIQVDKRIIEDLRVLAFTLQGERDQFHARVVELECEVAIKQDAIEALTRQLDHAEAKIHDMDDALLEWSEHQCGDVT